MDKRFITILVVVVLGLGAIFFIGKNKTEPVNSNTTSTVGATSNHVQGKNAKNVNLTVYGDFQCPICSEYYKLEKQIVADFGDDIEFRFMHFPLDSIHPNARAAARAAEAAGIQGKFFEMHDLIYENQSTWSGASDSLTIFASYAKSIGLDVEKFKTDFATEAVNSTINADLKDGNSKGVSGTPTYFLNGTQLKNGDISTYDKFSAKIQEAINSSK